MGKKAAIALCAMVLSVAGCVPAPPPTPPPIASAPPPAPPPPPPPTASAPPPPPACEAIEERCAAQPDTRIGVAQSGVSFVPPAGWHYAKQPAHALAQAPDGGAALIFGDSPGVKPELLWEAFNRLIEKLGVGGVEKKAIEWAKPHDRWKTDAVEVKVWEIERPKSGWSWQKQDPVMRGEPGSLLIAVSEINERVVLGVAFLARRAPAELVKPIRGSIESLQMR